MNGVIWMAPLSLLLAVSAVIPVSVHAQTPGTDRSECAQKAIDSSNAAEQINALGRAKNLARQAAEAANGGLANYRADASMHGPISIAPCVANGDGTWTFTVKGGKPGFTTPTQETVVKVDGSTWKTTIVSNGPIR